MRHLKFNLLFVYVHMCAHVHAKVHMLRPEDSPQKATLALSFCLGSGMKASQSCAVCYGHFAHCAMLLALTPFSYS